MSANKFDEKMDYLLAAINQKLTYEQELFDATPEELATLQKVTGQLIPADYIEFVSKYAGAYVEADFPLIKGGNGHISHFLPLDLDSTFALPRTYEVQENIPSHFFPISYGDNFSIYLSLREEDQGYVYFSAWEKIEPIFEEHLQLAATNFSDFINSLQAIQ